MVFPVGENPFVTIWAITLVYCLSCRVIGHPSRICLIYTQCQEQGATIVSIIFQMLTDFQTYKFRRKFSTTDNVLCRACADNAVKEMSSLSSASS